MRVYDIYRITSPDYEDRWSSGGQVVVYETYADERAARERAEELNGTRDNDDRKFLSFEIRERDRHTTYQVCCFPSVYDEDRWRGTDAVCLEHGYKSREAAERRALELNGDRDLSDPENPVYAVFEQTI